VSPNDVKNDEPSAPAVALPPLRFHHGGLSVPDLDASIAWWRGALGFEVEARFPIPQIPAEVAMLRRGDLRMELFAVPGAAPLSPDRRAPDLDVRTHGNKHVAFAIPDVDAMEADLRRRGVDIVFVGRFPWGANLFARDNAGNLVEFVQQPEMFAGP
jgi:methylmalonyl-CoA/ethylmalonyl-CoA epimerase